MERLIRSIFHGTGGVHTPPPPKPGNGHQEAADLLKVIQKQEQELEVAERKCCERRGGEQPQASA